MGAMRRLGLPVLMGVTLAWQAACHPTARLEPRVLRGALAPTVDSVVVRPFEKAARVQLNEADMAALTRHLREALDARERLHTFDAPPTLLPNTAVLAGRLERADVSERQGEGLTLRTIELEADVQVLPPEGDKPLRNVRRRVAWQRAYPGTVSGLPLDLALAFKELAGQLAQALVPETPEALQGGLTLWDGRDPSTGAGRSHASLLKGNQFAASGHLELATQTWQRVIFDPRLRAGTPLYQVTPATLELLRHAGLSDDVLERMQPLVGQAPGTFNAFRRRLHAAVGGILPNEGLVLSTTDTSTADMHRNLAAAHANLAAVYALQGRDDLAAYHLAHAWAHEPDPALLERWHALQSQRQLLPSNLTDAQAIDLYLRLPPPSTARVWPGKFERTVAPPPAFAQVDAAPDGSNPGQPDGTAPAPPTTAAPAAPDLKPTALPPPDSAPAAPTAPQAGPETAPATESANPGGAAGSGPSEPAATPVAAPTTQPAPVAQ